MQVISHIKAMCDTAVRRAVYDTCYVLYYTCACVCVFMCVRLYVLSGTLPIHCSKSNVAAEIYVYLVANIKEKRKLEYPVGPAQGTRG